MANPPTVVILVTKRNPIVRLGRPQKYRWTAVNWGNRTKLARSTEAYTNYADCVAAAIELFADATADPEVLAQGKADPTLFLPSEVYLIQDGVGGMQPLRTYTPNTQQTP